MWRKVLWRDVIEKWHSNLTKCCACHQKWASDITTFCRTSPNVAAACSCHEKWLCNITRCSLCHKNWHCNITKYCTCHEKGTPAPPNVAAATKSHTATSNAAPATKSDTATSPNAPIPRDVTLQHHQMLPMQEKSHYDLWHKSHATWRPIREWSEHLKLPLHLWTCMYFTTCT